MSFLNSVLSSIGGTGPEASKGSAPNLSKSAIQATGRGVVTKSATTGPETAPAFSSGNARGLSKPTSSVQPASNGPRPPSDLKRKADPLPSSPPAKLRRTESPAPQSKNAVIPSHPKQDSAPATNTNAVRPISRPTTPSIPSAPPFRAGSIGGKPLVTATPPPKPTIKSVVPAETQTKPINRDVSNSVQSPKIPPRGSYKEIMARAEAAKAAQTDFGQIKHKSVPKLSKSSKRAQETAAAAAAAAAQQKGKDPVRQAPAGKREEKTGNAARSVVKPGEPSVEQKRKAAADLGYKGTMRPTANESDYKGTIRSNATGSSRAPVQASRSSVPKRPPDRGNGDKRYTYASYSDEEDEEEEEDYDDESDMEAAGFDDLMDEEEESLRYAKKEDAEALAQENDLRRAKLERRNKLAQLAASRKK